MDKDIIQALAKRAGLDKALAEFPDDIASAAQQAEGGPAKMIAPTDPTSEPWPAMRAGEGR